MKKVLLQMLERPQMKNGKGALQFCGGVGCGGRNPARQMDKCRESEADAKAMAKALCGRRESSKQVGSSERQGRGRGMGVQITEGVQGHGGGFWL